MTQSATTAKLPPTPRRPVEHDLLLAALPHPILVLAPDNRIVYANAAAEAFLSTGIAVLKRTQLDEIVAFAGIEKFLDTPVKRYSSGMYVRLAFAVAAQDAVGNDDLNYSSNVTISKNSGSGSISGTTPAA